VRRLSLVALASVIAQGCLGGARVLLDDRQLALLHGCAGPAFLALCAALCAFTARTWKDSKAVVWSDGGSSLHVWVATVAGLAYVQLVLGAFLRHIPPMASPGFFRLAIFAHLIFAGLVTLQIFVVGWRVTRRKTGHKALRIPAWVLMVLVVGQLVLGCATWVVNYYWPYWSPDWDLLTGYPVIEAKGWIQTMIVTAHAATGSLIVAVSVLLMLRAFRLVRGKGKTVVARQPSRARGGVAA
jgi:cytochrome c oxidase assembly protein subunit 15